MVYLFLCCCITSLCAYIFRDKIMLKLFGLVPHGAFPMFVSIWLESQILWALLFGCMLTYYW